jgi:hypothetical protein
VSLTGLLDANRRGRDDLVDRIREVTEPDEAVTAVILCGSLGRGDADAWSDIDVVVFVDDERLPSVVADRLGMPNVIAPALYVLDSPWNAPPGGAQLNALYRLPSGCPIYVDWNVWPASMTAVPTDGRGLSSVEPFLAWTSISSTGRPSPDVPS